MLDRADINTLPMDRLDNLVYENVKPTQMPSFYKGHFNAEDIGDTFLKLDGFTKGFAMINGFNLGRYWSKGPQRTLYVPAPLIKDGINEIVVFDFYGTDKPSASLIDEHILDMCD